MPFAVPPVVVSGCLQFEPCRYNGQRISFDPITELEPFVEYVPVCPEVEIGLGTPRPPVRPVAHGAGQRLFQPETGRDLTSDMDGFATRFLDGVTAVDGFLLKSRSPSCGPHGVKVYDRADAPSTAGRSPGRFAALVRLREARSMRDVVAFQASYKLTSLVNAWAARLDISSCSSRRSSFPSRKP